MSTWLCLGSANTMPSNDGTSIPSVRHRAFVSTRGRSPFSSHEICRLRSDAFIDPSTVFASTVMWRPRQCANTGTAAAKSFARLILEWNEISRFMSKRSIACSEASSATSADASTALFKPSSSTEPPARIVSRSAGSSTATTTTS